VLSLYSAGQVFFTKPGTKTVTDLILSDTSTHWVFTKSSTTCHHTASAYNEDTHKGAFYITQNGRYLNFENSATTPMTVTSPTNNGRYQLFDFIKFTTLDSNYPSLSNDNGAYFGIMTDFNSNFPSLALAIKAEDGSFGQYSSRPSYYDINADSYYNDSNGYGLYFRLYRISLTPAESLAQLKNTYKDQISDATAKSFGVSVDTGSYTAQIDAITASTDAAVTAAESQMKNIVDAFKKAVVNAIYDRFDGKLFTIQNCGSDMNTNIGGYYMGSSTAVNETYMK